jgi:SAM-dependent methyltransferase
MRVEAEPSIPSESSTRRIREIAVESRPEDAGLRSWYEQYASDHSQRIAFDLDLIEREQPFGSRVLECGSVPLLLTLAMAARYELTGIDIAPERFAGVIRERRLNVLAHNIETDRLPFEDASFDAIIFNELFEHLRINPVFTLREVHRVLAPAGKLFLSTPNLRSVDGIFNFLVRGRAYSCCGGIYEEYQKLEGLGHMGHVREYTPVEVVTFLQQVGFRVDAVVFRGRPSGLLGAGVTRLLPRLKPFASYIAVK